MFQIWYLNISKLRYISSLKLRKMCTSSNEIIVEKLGKMTTIGINRPDKRNCLNSKTALLMKEAIEQFEDDNSSYVAIIHGVGGNFCSGFDYKELANCESSSRISEKMENGLMKLPKYVKKPMVAAISGYAVGGGLELALLCDLRVMEDTAVLGNYSRRFGVPLVDGGTVRLQAIVGLSRAMDMILTGRSLNAKEAFEWGIANRLVACGTGLGQAIQLAGSLVKFPQECLHIDRESTYNAVYNKAYKELLDAERQHAKELSAKYTIIEGAKKFLSGLGKHGKTYNLNPKEISDWERDYDQHINTTSKSKL